jgi:Fe-Mn family superoxide dismutase
MPVKTSLIAFCALAVLPAAASPALALDISARGADIFLNGPINLGDHAKFERFMMENHGQSFRTVHLNSPGGWSSDMREIARDIRKARLNTAVDGSRAICASACTVLFAAGVQRFYHGADKVPEGVRTAVRNNGGGHANHTLFWESLGKGKGGEPSGHLAEAIRSVFGGFDRFKEELTKAALGRFGSGWAWLSVDPKGKLLIESTANQDSPIMHGNKPLFGIDVWEHAYYLLYQNRRVDYVNAVYNVIDWNAVGKRFVP